MNAMCWIHTFWVFYFFTRLDFDKSLNFILFLLFSLCNSILFSRTRTEQRAGVAKKKKKKKNKRYFVGLLESSGSTSNQKE